MNIDRRTRSLSMALPVLAALVMSTPSEAEDVGSRQMGPIGTTPLVGRIEIPSDGSQYLQPAEAVTLNTEVAVYLHAGRIGRVKNWQLWFKTKIDGEGFGDQSEHAYPPVVSEAYPLGSRPKSVDVVRFLVQDFDRGTDYCNDNANLLRSLGFSNEEIFADDRILPLAVDIGLGYDFSGLDGMQIFGELQDQGLGQHYPQEPVELVCQAYDPYPEGGLQAGDGLSSKQNARITYANLALMHDQQPTECPAQVTVQALFASDTLGSFSFRFQNAWQQVSQAIELEMTPADYKGGHYTKVFETQFLVGEEVDTSGMFGEDQTAGDGKQLNPLGGGGEGGITGGLGNLVTEETPDNVHGDSLWVEILSAAANSVETSDMEAYSITCEEESGSTIALPVDGKTYALPDGSRW